jgi:hypothetical protein
MRTIVAILFMTFANQASARDINVGSLLICESMDAMRVWSYNDFFQKEGQQKFMVKVGQDTLYLSAQEGYLIGETSLKKEYHQSYFITGYDSSANLSIERKDKKFRFHYSSTMSMSMFTMFGYCYLL